MDYFNDRLIVPLAGWLARDPNLVDFENLTYASVMIAILFAAVTAVLIAAERSVRRGLAQRHGYASDPGHVREEVEDALAYDDRDEVTLSKADVVALVRDRRHIALPQSPLSGMLRLLSFLFGLLAIVALYWAYRYYTHA